MPTLQITPNTPDLLQDVADMLTKSRKMVIITGAGISTNSGIPDFRSENGLYSLIQEQFERAEANARKELEHDDNQTSFDVADRPSKRRRLSHPDSDDSSEPPSLDQPLISSPQVNGSQKGIPSATDTSFGLTKTKPTQAHATAPETEENPFRRLTRSRMLALRPPISRHLTQDSMGSSTTRVSTSSDQAQSSSSSQTDVSITDDIISRTSPKLPTYTPKKTRLDLTSSSPLSSPPPILFDPYENLTSSTDGSSPMDTDSSDGSDCDETQQSMDPFSLQNSNANIRNMKGRDLFDCNIWADPLKTSVFYRFATSLRQRVKEVEPTATHRFIAQMRDVGKLARVYTQNIDEIEKKIGLSTDLKHGAGNKRRKSTKQPVPESGKVDKEGAESPDDERTRSGAFPAQADQQSEDQVQAKSRQTPSPDKGVECVFLHGSLHSLRCFVCGKLCDWDEEGRELCTLSGEQPECPHCAGATAARQERGKRALGIGKLRPDIVLYGEEHPQSDLISPIVQHDLAGNPDLLLVLGTSLRVHGLKVMVREFAKAVHKKGGKVVFINFTKPSDSVWGDVLDYWIDWDCDAWVEDLKSRKPNLWLSLEELQELDRQKREALAGKRRETLKKRESMNEKKRESIGDTDQPASEELKPRIPPKNPAAMRNDYHCGAYVVWEIFQTLAKIGDRPFDNLGYVAPTPSSGHNPELKESSNRAADPETESCIIAANTQPSPKAEGDQGPDAKKVRHRLPTKRSASRRTKPQPGAGLVHTSVQTSSPSGDAVNDPKLSAATSSLQLINSGSQDARAVVKTSKVKRNRKSAPAVLDSVASTDHQPLGGTQEKGHDQSAGKDQYLKAVRHLAKSRKTPTPRHSMPSNISTTPDRQHLSFEPYSAPLHPALKLRPVHEQARIDESHGMHLTTPYMAQPRPILPPPDCYASSQPGSAHHLSTMTISRIETNYQGPALAPLLNWNWRKSPPEKIKPMEPSPLFSPLSPLADMRTSPTQSPYSTMHPPMQAIQNRSLMEASNQPGPRNMRSDLFRSPHDNTPSPSDQLRLEAAYQLSQMSGKA
ncbi:DHS-like NAD/FAD-binding domain-containing protein [Xylariaceae sp. FL1272]|nr:DHS-like NAD/FAD-binding domain-containing protein [Xylariaceae sp. FL1272]